MKIKIDYYLEQEGMNRVCHYIITDADIQEFIIEKFRRGDLQCPIHFDKELSNIKVAIDEVLL